MSCRACNAPTQPGDNYCARCGTAIDASDGKPDSPTSEGTPLSELKFVTVLRCDLVGSTELVFKLSPEDAVEFLRPALDVMRSAVRLYGGIVCREMGDGILAVFGAPAARDDHAVASLYAAFELLRRMRETNPTKHMRIGIHSGFVMTHVLSTEYSFVYDVGGPVLNLVERLQLAAEPDQIYVSDACRHLCEGFVSFEALPPTRLKGFPDPIAIFRAASSKETSSWRVRASRTVSPFSGRSTEIETLRREAKLATTIFGRCVLIDGDPGIGKSRLVHEFIAELRAEGWRVVEADCDPLRVRAPFSTLKQTLKSALCAIGSDSPTQLDALSNASRAAVCSVLDLDVCDDQWATMEPKQRARAIAVACREVLDLVTKAGTTVLVIEDLHWIDHASGEALANALQMSDNRRSLLALMTSRTGDAPAWVSQCAATRVLLKPLDNKEAMDLLASLIGTGDDLERLKLQILRHTGKIPLFIEEVCRELWDKDAVATLRQRRWDENLALGVPATVQGLIAARIDRLPRRDRTLLQAASVFGSECPTALLQRVVCIREPLFWDGVDKLVLAGALRFVDGGEPVLTFPHDLVRQVAYESMLGSTRLRWHRVVLDILEGDAQYGRRQETLCHHALMAGDWPKTFVYARDVARKCVERSALAEGTEFSEIAINALDHLPASPERERDAIDLRIEARMALSESGQISRWLSLAKEATDRAALAGDSLRLMGSMAVRSAALNFYGSAREAVAEGERVLLQARRLGDRGWLNYANYGLGQAHFMAGEFVTAERILKKAYAKLSLRGAQAITGTTAVDLQLVCCMMMTLTQVALGQLERADFFQLRATALTSETPRPYGKVAAGYGRGVYLLAIDDLGSARACLEETLALAMKHDVGLFIPVITCQLGICFLECDQLDKAMLTLSQAKTQAEKTGHRSAYLRSSLNLAQATAYSGFSRLGYRLARKSRIASAKGGYQAIEVEAMLTEARIISKASDRHTEALIERLNRVVEITQRLKYRQLLAKARNMLGDVLPLNVANGDERSRIQNIGSLTAH